MQEHPLSSKKHMEIHHEGDMIHVTFPRGRIDGTAVQTMFDAAAQLVPGPDTRLLVDLTGVKSCNSGGVGMMVTLLHRVVGVGAKFHLVIPTPEVRDVFSVMHLEKILSIYDTVDEAVAAFEA